MQESNTPGTEKGNPPYVPLNTTMKELTFKAILLGVVLAIILGAANAYLGLRAGMTVAATFPAAVIAMAVLRVFKGTILEENMARTTGAVGEALAAGAIFTIPAFILAGVWQDLNYFKSTMLMLVGGILGVLFVIVLRKTLIDDETLKFPESLACAEIVKAGQGGQSGAKYVFGSMGIAALIELFKNDAGIKLIQDSLTGFYQFNLAKIKLLTSKGDTISELSYRGGMIAQSPAASPAFLGVGYIIGYRLSAITFSGGVFGWLFLMPIALFLMYNQLDPISSVSWITLARSAYNAAVKPIAVGGMLVSAFYTLFRMRKNLVSGIGRGIQDIKSAGSSTTATSRVDKDLPFGMVMIAIVVLVLCMVILYQSFSHSWGSAVLAALVMAVAGFIFAAVAGYLVGIIGSSSNPISGLTLSTLLIAALLMVLVGMKGDPGVAAVLAVASVVCCVAGVAGDMMQDWKVGYLLGGTPWRMQIGGLIGVVAAALVMVIPIMLLHKAYGIGSEAIPAPQAGLMAMMSKGIVGGEMAWPLVIAGMLFAIALILINAPSPMLISVGMYLPFNTTSAIFIGGVIKLIVDKLAEKKVQNQTDRDTVENTGLLLASGLVAGEALTGIIFAALYASDINLRSLLGFSAGFNGFWWLGLITFIALGYLMVKVPLAQLARRQAGK